jgi:hypothetical protein
MILPFLGVRGGWVGEKAILRSVLHLSKIYNIILEIFFLNIIGRDSNL